MGDSTRKFGANSVRGDLFFRLLDGSSINCLCIKEPFVSQVVEACAADGKKARAEFNRKMQEAVDRSFAAECELRSAAVEIERLKRRIAELESRA